MKYKIAKINYDKHQYIGTILFTQAMKGIKEKNKKGNFFALHAFQVIYNEVKNVLEQNDEIIILLKNLLSKKEFLKNNKISEQLFVLLKNDFKLHNDKDNKYYEFEEEKDDFLNIE